MVVPLRGGIQSPCLGKVAVSQTWASSGLTGCGVLWCSAVLSPDKTGEWEKMREVDELSVLGQRTHLFQ